jgi:hypothetical protein
MPSDPWEIPTPDPSRSYRWLSDDPKRLSLWLRSFGDVQGFVLEPDANCDKLGLPDSYRNRATGRITYGHNILASIPMEQHKRREAEKIEETLERIYDAKQAFHAVGDALPGVTTFEEHPDESADRKRIATRPDRPFSGQSGRGDSPVFQPR